MRVLAVDLGATSARVASIDLGSTPPTVTIIHRVAHSPIRDGPVLRWDWPRLMDAVRTGLELGIDAGPVASIGVDTWGVDYGVLDDAGALIEPPVSYRTGFPIAPLDPVALYRTTGIQVMDINTVHQLAARRSWSGVRRVLMLPALVVHELCGAALGEHTSAGTTGMVDLSTGDWSPWIVDAIGVDPAILPPLSPPGTRAGAYRGVPIHLVAGHDTACAVVAAPGSAFVSSGTWMIVGREQPAADTSDAARTTNFSNEPGALGGVRFLRNVVGLGLLEQVLGGASLDLDAAAAAPVRIVDVDDVDPPALVAELGVPGAARSVIESIAAAVASVLASLAPVSDVHLVGGGTANPLLVRALAARTGLPVRSGHAEATALGNGLLQGIALGRYGSLAEARAALEGPAGGRAEPVRSA